MAKGKLYTEEEKQYIADNYGKISTCDIAEKLNRTPEQIWAYSSLLRKQGRIKGYLTRDYSNMRKGKRNFIPY